MQYASAQACAKGHWISTDTRYSRAAFCAACGSVAVAHCEKCNTYLPGDLVDVFTVSPSNLPAYCHQCGHAWPWTEAKAAAFIEMAEAIEELTEAEVSNLRDLLPDVITEGPRTKVAAFKITAIVSRAKTEGVELLRGILRDIAVDTAKELMGFPKGT